jgi:hypothetical protein
MGNRTCPPAGLLPSKNSFHKLHDGIVDAPHFLTDADASSNGRLHLEDQNLISDPLYVIPTSIRASKTDFSGRNEREFSFGHLRR